MLSDVTSIRSVAHAGRPATKVSGEAQKEAIEINKLRPHPADSGDV